MTLRGGHYNVFGIREFFLRSTLIREDLAEYIAYLKGLGAFIQLNHPNDPQYGSKYGYEFDFDLIEVLNGNPTPDDYQTIADYQTLLCAGRKIVATSNTDAHRNHTVRRNFNCVLSTARTSEAIMDAIRAGRLYFTTTVNGPVISLTCGEAVMGATVARKDGQKAEISIRNLPAGSSVRIYTSDGLSGDTPAEGTFVASVPTAGCRFVRCEVWQAEGIIAMSNPIYFE